MALLLRQSLVEFRDDCVGGESNGDLCEPNDGGLSLDVGGGDQFMAEFGFPRVGRSLALKSEGRDIDGGVAES